MQQDVRSVEVCIRLLGMPAWWRPGGGPPVSLSRKDAAVLAVLALDGPQPRERLAAMIWPDVPAARASSNLRQRLFRLRQQTGHLLIDYGELLRPAAGLRMDLQQLDGGDTAADMPIDPGEELLGALDFAEDGDLLDDWVRRARQVWRTRRVDLLTGRAARHEATGELAAALATVERLLTIDPLQEHAWRRLMRLHHRRSDRAAAVAAFERCEQVLKDELGLNGYSVPYFTDPLEMLNAVPDIDVVNVCTPNGLHAPLSILALGHGKHVCEKPMGLSKASCESVIYKALQMHRHVFGVMQNRYSPPSQWIKGVVDGRILGYIYMVQVNCYWNRDARYYKPGNWKGSQDLDGGRLFTQFRSSAPPHRGSPWQTTAR